MFITFEGIEGSGKSVQVRRAHRYLESRGYPCLVTREPGGTDFGASVRQILLRQDGVRREPVAELLLYLADRYQHLAEVVFPAVRRGDIVLSDRYHDATCAYQGAGRGVSQETIDLLARGLEIRDPDRTILLDLEPSVGIARARTRNRSTGRTRDEGRFEAEDLRFHQQVRDAYLDRARQFPDRIQVVSATGSEQEVFQRIVPCLEEWVDRTE